MATKTVFINTGVATKEQLSQLIAFGQELTQIEAEAAQIPAKSPKAAGMISEVMGRFVGFINENLSLLVQPLGCCATSRNGDIQKQLSELFESQPKTKLKNKPTDETESANQKQ